MRVMVKHQTRVEVLSPMLRRKTRSSECSMGGERH